MKLKKPVVFILTLMLLSVQLLPICVYAIPESYSNTLNSGVRDEVCTSVAGTGIAAYYTGSNTYDALSALEADALLTALRTLMTETHDNISSYADCRDYADETSCENGDGRIVMLYTSYSGTYSQYSNGQGWNREHVWPKSLGGFGETGGGADLHHIRPAENRTNTQRSNRLYGNVTNGTASTGNLSGAVGGAYAGDYYEPNDNVKGDVARICLYVWVRWGGTYSQSSNILNVFESVDTLLSWCAMDPVDTWEMGRNEVVEEIQGNRNVFIDYPELAWLLFDRAIPTDMITPSGKAQNTSATPSTPSVPSTPSTPTTPDTPDTPDTPTECTHAQTVLKNAKAATCIENGYTGDTYCASCDVLLSQGESEPPTGVHSMNEGEIVIQPTENVTGFRKYTCTVCGYREMEEIPKLESKSYAVYIVIGGVAIIVVAGGVTAFVIIRRRKRS